MLSVRATGGAAALAGGPPRRLGAVLRAAAGAGVPADARQHAVAALVRAAARAGVGATARVFPRCVGGQEDTDLGELFADVLGLPTGLVELLGDGLDLAIA